MTSHPIDLASGSSWHYLTGLTQEGIGDTEIMAATCIDGIGVFVRWVRDKEDPEKWSTFAMDSEGGTWEVVFDEEGNEIPLSPPSCLLTYKVPLHTPKESSRAEEFNAAQKKRCLAHNVRTRADMISKHYLSMATTALQTQGILQLGRHTGETEGMLRSQVDQIESHLFKDLGVRLEPLLQPTSELPHSFEDWLSRLTKPTD